MSLRRLTLLLLALACLVAAPVAANEAWHREESEEALAALVPPDAELTEEWKTLEPGQTVPRGVDVRMDLSTGKKMAKKMKPGESRYADYEDKPAPSGPSMTVVDKVDLSQIPEDVLDRYAAAEERRSVKTNMKVDPERERAELEKHAKMLFGGNGGRASDAEMMSALLQFVAANSTSSEDRARALQDLETYVDSIDNGMDLIKLGVSPIIGALQSTTDTSEVRGNAAWVVAAAAQNNPPAQEGFFDAGALPFLVNILKSDTDDVRARQHALSAIGNLCRHFPKAEAALVKLDGIKVLANILHSPHQPVVLKKKLVAFVYDVLAEMEDMDDMSNMPLDGLHASFESEDWCRLTCDQFHEARDKSDLDFVEKLLMAVRRQSIGGRCGDALDRSRAVIDGMRRKWLAAEPGTYMADLRNLADAVLSS